ncbi:PH domain-containing protein [Fictibacillus enclensis]|uniref:PH domain-containing protein n=1 Tax=Fictibacillus enclensis TaxID=1017270 RepID=UPI0025A2CD08|nr:PH domain-containing protein [Fictibacillus enclensis]MDM5336305.1 PH domain-containing protein [Fictibacillus enclensis]
MLKRLASDALGLSDVGSVIKPADYDKVDADDYVFHEDNEKIYFLIKSKTDEYCFTNRALIHLDGTSAVSKKRMLHRYSYSENTISNVSLETAGTVDLDVEIKFVIGSVPFSIDVHKKHIEELKDLYKSLSKIAEIAHENEFALQYAQQSINVASTTLSRIQSKENELVESFNQLNDAAFTWLMESRKEYHMKDYGYVFEKYINN